MNLNEGKAPLRVLVSITTPKLAGRAAEMFRKADIPVQYRWNAVGTASSEMIDMLGLGSPDKKILVSFMPKPVAGEMLKKLKKELRLGTINSGIAFTLPLSGANGIVLRILEQLNEKESEVGERKGHVSMSDVKYSVVAAVVNQGYSENVMEAAKEMGASGGTVVPSRYIGNEQSTSFWGMSLQNEKDMVLIITDNSKKLDIMQAIGEKCGIHSEAKGIVVSLPIDAVIGIDTED